MHKTSFAVAFLAALTCCGAAEPPIAGQANAKSVPRLVGPGDIYPLWSIVGEWRVTHPQWTGVMQVKADGTVLVPSQESTGRWSLGAEGGTPLLVVRWDKFGTESFAMIGPDHFRAQCHPDGFADMRRGE